MSGKVVYNTVTEGLVLYLDAANTKSYPGSGLIWDDVSKFGNKGTFINGPTFSNDSGGSITLDGTNDYFLINNSSLWKNNTNLSLSIWCNFSGLTNSIYSLINKGDQGSNNYFWLSLYNPLVYPNPNLGLMWEFGDGLGNQWQFRYLWTPTIDNWYHITATFEPGNPKIYINGSLVPATTYYVSPTPPAIIGATQDGGTFNFCVGSYRDIAHYFQGKINQVMFYKKTLSASEVLQNYNATKVRYL
jgi:hypothetical protein